MNKSFFQRILFTIVTILFITGFCSCGILPDDDETLAPPTNIKTRKTDYELYKVVRKDIAKTIKGTGDLVSYKRADLFFKESGARIKSINVTDGQIVKKGDILVSIDIDDMSDNARIQESEIQKLQMQLDSQKSLLKKYESLPKDYQPSQKDFNDMVSSIKTTELDLENLKITLSGLKRKISQSTLIAPFDGIITFKDSELKAGNIIEAYRRIISISDPSCLQLSYRPPTEEWSLITSGMKVEITYKGTKYEGVVTMSPYDVPDTAQENNKGLVLINIKKLPAEAKLGENLSFNIVIKSKSNVITIPKRAVKVTTGGKIALIMDGEDKKQVNVETGIETSLDVEILSGLKEGQKVILN